MSAPRRRERAPTGRLEAPSASIAPGQLHGVRPGLLVLGGNRYECNEEFARRRMRASHACTRCPDQSYDGRQGIDVAPCVQVRPNNDANRSSIPLTPRCARHPLRDLPAELDGLQRAWQRARHAARKAGVVAAERVGDDAPLRFDAALPAAECERDGEPTAACEGAADESRERWGVGGLGCRAGRREPLCAKWNGVWAVGFDGLEQCSDEVRRRSSLRRDRCRRGRPLCRRRLARVHPWRAHAKAAEGEEEARRARRPAVAAGLNGMVVAAHRALVVSPLGVYARRSADEIRGAGCPRTKIGRLSASEGAETSLGGAASAAVGRWASK